MKEIKNENLNSSQSDSSWLLASSGVFVQRNARNVLMHRTQKTHRDNAMNARKIRNKRQTQLTQRPKRKNRSGQLSEMRYVRFVAYVACVAFVGNHAWFSFQSNREERRAVRQRILSYALYSCINLRVARQRRQQQLALQEDQCAPSTLNFRQQFNIGACAFRAYLLQIVSIVKRVKRQDNVGDGPVSGNIYVC